MSLFFCAIANEKSIVCKHAIANRDFSNIVESYLSRQVAEGHLFYSEQNVGVHALKVSGISFVAVTELQTPRQQPVQFLTELTRIVNVSGIMKHGLYSSTFVYIRKITDKLKIMITPYCFKVNGTIRFTWL
ncbi:hypothetical protein AHF37_02271 [Paragonimus kellicotti]|nr:hypothetical protein AHF37_02271 [Paragonimus kellicotti]